MIIIELKCLANQQKGLILHLTYKTNTCKILCQNFCVIFFDTKKIDTNLCQKFSHKIF